MFVGLGLRQGNGKGRDAARCSLPAPALFTYCRENYCPFVCVKGLLPLPSVQWMQWQAHVCVCVSVCLSVHVCVSVTL